MQDRPQPHFPDSRIGASLKPAAMQYHIYMSADFPDSRIGASLKLAVRVHQHLDMRTSPIRESGPH